MAQLEISQSSIAALEGIVQPLRDDILGLGETLKTVGKQTKKSSGKDKKDKQKADKSFLDKWSGGLDQISLGLPGGARLFGLGKFLNAINRAETPLGKLGVGFTQLSIAVYGAVEGLRALGRRLGGVTADQALGMTVGMLGQTIRGGRIRGIGSMMQAQTAFSGEFGGALSSGAVGKQADIANDLGISIQELTELQRVFQTLTPDIRNSVNAFKESGITGRVAAKEMVKASDAIALAGDNFNEYIKDGIVNAKKLGYEFMQVHNKLTGFSMDFEGTVSSFSQLRAVIPGFATDFGQLMTTALTGSPDEYVEMIREGLVGAGITSASDMNRQQAALLQQATGFSAAQIDRLLKGEDVELETVDLDTDRNSLLTKILAAVSIGLGIISMKAGASMWGKAAGVAAAVGDPNQYELGLGGAGKAGKGVKSVGKFAKFLRVIPKLAGAAAFIPGVGLVATGALLAGGMAINHFANKKANDFMIKDGEFIDINDRDMVGMLPKGQSLSSAGLNSQQAAYGGGFSARMDSMEMKKQTQAINNLARVMSGPQEINLKNWRQAERSAMDASIREA